VSHFNRTDLHAPFLCAAAAGGGPKVESAAFCARERESVVDSSISTSRPQGGALDDIEFAISAEMLEMTLGCQGAIVPGRMVQPGYGP
jgi:hypothetical protein